MVGSVINSFNGGMKGKVPTDVYGLTGEKNRSPEVDSRLLGGYVGYVCRCKLAQICISIKPVKYCVCERNLILFNSF